MVLAGNKNYMGPGLFFSKEKYQYFRALKLIKACPPLSLSFI